MPSESVLCLGSVRGFVSSFENEYHPAILHGTQGPEKRRHGIYLFVFNFVKSETAVDRRPWNRWFADVTMCKCVLTPWSSPSRRIFGPDKQVHVIHTGRKLLPSHFPTLGRLFTAQGCPRGKWG